MPSRDKILEKLAKTLDAERYKHCLRAEKIALALARKYRINKAKTSLAALLHDCARRWGRSLLLKKARRLGLTLDPIRRFEPKLFHGEIGAWLARREFGVRSAAVLQAIRNHTTGAPGMSKLEKIIYLADHIEEGRKFPGVKSLRQQAFQDLDRAICASASAMIRFLLAKKLPIYPPTVATRNYFLPAGRHGLAKL